MTLKELARRAGVTGRQIAEAADVSESAVSFWMHGRTLIPSRHLRTVARMLGVTVDELLNAQGVSDDGQNSRLEEQAETDGRGDSKAGH